MNNFKSSWIDMAHRKVGWLHVVPFQTLLNFSTDIHLKILQDHGFKTVADKFIACTQSFSGDSLEKMCNWCSIIILRSIRITQGVLMALFDLFVVHLFVFRVCSIHIVQLSS